MSYDPDHQRCDLTKNIECKNGERPNWTPPEGCKIVLFIVNIFSRIRYYLGGQSESVTSYVVTKTTSHFHVENNIDDNVQEVKKRTRATKKRKTTIKPINISYKMLREYTTVPISQLVESSDCRFQGNMPDPDNCQCNYI